MSKDCIREPNANCKVCNKAIYRRPFEIKLRDVYCSRICFMEDKHPPIKEIPCLACKQIFKPKKKTSKFCSRVCSNLGRTGISYPKDYFQNDSKRRLALLFKTFDFDSCMIEGCCYNRFYEIHRPIQGKDGGEYVIGNMFAICPNHHREIHSRLIEVEVVNDYTLKIVRDNAEDLRLSLDKQINKPKIVKSKKPRKSRAKPKSEIIRKPKLLPTKKCKICDNLIEDSYTYCSPQCSAIGQRNVDRPSKEELYELLWSMPTTKISKQYNVSDKAVEKWVKSYGLNKPPRGYWAKLNAKKE